MHDEDAYANLVLPARLTRAGVSGRDAAFATELTYGTLRLRGRHDALIARLAGRPVDRLDPPVLDVLRLGVHQLTAMRVPAHAAVGESVALARAYVGSGAAGLVNAVLRRAAERTWEQWRGDVLPDGPEHGLERLAVEYSHPTWVVRAMRAALADSRDGGPGASPAEQQRALDSELVRLLEADNTPATPTLVARPGLVDAERMAETGARPLEVAPTAWAAPPGDPASLAVVREGVAAVQDAGSQLIPLALADVALGDPANADPGERWLDLCAGPGGKSGLLAALARQRPGTSLLATEIAPHLADLVRRAVAAAVRAGSQVEVEVRDGRALGEAEPEGFDRVLVDAPCTGLGALRRRPEARWRRTAADLTTLGPLQRELLTSALHACRPGGVVAYVTCSPHLAETRFVVRDVVGQVTGTEIVDARPHVRDRSGAPLPDVGPGPFVQLWPHRHGTDAMFLALLRCGPAREQT